MGLLICYEIEIPEPARILALKVSARSRPLRAPHAAADGRSSAQGAQLILVPTASFGKQIPDTLVPARAIENNCFVAYCNRCGAEPRLILRERAVAEDSTDTTLFGGRSVAVCGRCRPRPCADIPVRAGGT